MEGDRCVGRVSLSPVNPGWVRPADGVSKGYLSQIESGHKFGTLDRLRRLAAVLDVTLDDLAGWK